MFRWGVFGAAVIMLGTIAGLPWGTTGVAWGWSTAMVLLVLPCLIYGYRGAGLTLRRLVRAVGGVYAAAACALPIAWVTRELLAGLPAVVGLAGGLGLALISYVALSYLVFGQKELIRNAAQRLLPKSGRAAA
jgi:hypothetical protein